MNFTLWLQAVNILLAAASAYVFYLAPDFWGGQAQLYFGLAGMVFGAWTAAICAFSLLFGKGEGAAAVHGVLGLGLAVAQGFWLWRFGTDVGVIEFLRQKLKG